MMRSLALLASRAIIGGIFIANGYPKLFGGREIRFSPVVPRYLGSGFVEAVGRGGLAATSAAFRGLGIPLPEVMSPFVAFLEFVGGTLLVLGGFTRPIALLLAGNMAVAIQRVTWRNGLIGPGGFEAPLALLAGCLGLVGAGPGDISIDHLVASKLSRRHRKGTNLAPIVVGAATIGVLLARLRQRSRQSVPASVA